MVPPALAVAEPAGREAERLEALARYAVLDTPPEPVFDGLANAAAELAGVPTALVSFIDAERQWYKAKVGIEVCSVGRDLAFCDHVVRSGCELVVGDTLEDPRFAAHPMVIGEPFIRCYAGLPLTTADGHVLGTLCVVGDRPRRLSDAQLRGLRALASQVMSQLELRSALAREAEGTAALRRSEAQMRAALDAMPRDITLLDVDYAAGEPVGLRVAWINRHIRAGTGLSLDDVVGRPLAEVFPAVAAELGADYLEVARTKAPLRRQLDSFDGRHLSGAIDVTAVPWSVDGLLVDAEDVTARRSAELALAASRRRLEQAQASARIATWEWDLQTGRVQWSHRLREMFDAPADLEPSLLHMIEMVHPDDREGFTAAYHRLLTDGSPITLEHRIRASDGSLRWVRAWASLERDGAGVPCRVEGSKQDITEERRREAALTEQALLDPLTDLPNRRGWDQAAPALLADARTQGRPACVAVIDLDHFKRVNDRLGHAAGDSLLRRAAAGWLRTVRADDLLARVGGEEFALLIPGCDLPDAADLVERLRRSLPEGATASAGLALIGAGETLGAATRRADAALYEAKRAGRDRCHLA